jgi:hypothetical protein
MKAADNSSGLFDHMNQKNMTKAEMDQMKRVKKRKINSISNTNDDAVIELSKTSTVTFKEPIPVKKTP